MIKSDIEKHKRLKDLARAINQFHKDLKNFNEFKAIAPRRAGGGTSSCNYINVQEKYSGAREACRLLGAEKMSVTIPPGRSAEISLQGAPISLAIPREPYSASKKFGHRFSINGD